MYLSDLREPHFATIILCITVLAAARTRAAMVVLDLVNTHVDNTSGLTRSRAFLSPFYVFRGSADKIQLILSRRSEELQTDDDCVRSRSCDWLIYKAALELVKNSEVQVIPSPLRSKPSATPVRAMTTIYMIRVVPSRAKSANGTSHVFKDQLTMGNGSVSFLQLVPTLSSCCIITEEKKIVVRAGLASIRTYGISDSLSIGRVLDGVEGFLFLDAAERNEWRSLDPNLDHSLSSVALDDDEEVKSCIFEYDYEYEDELESSISENDGEDAVELPAKLESCCMEMELSYSYSSKHDKTLEFKGLNRAMSSRSKSRHEDKNSLILVETLSWELWLLMSWYFLLNFLIGSAIWIRAQRRKEEIDQPVGRGDEFRNDFFRMKTFDIREDAIGDDDDVIVGYGGGTGSSLAVVASTDEDGESRRRRKAFWKNWWAQIKRKTSSLVRMR